MIGFYRGGAFGIMSGGSRTLNIYGRAWMYAANEISRFVSDREIKWRLVLSVAYLNFSQLKVQFG